VVNEHVNLVPHWNGIDIGSGRWRNRVVPQTRFDEMLALAEENDGLLTTRQAREAGIADSVLRASSSAAGWSVPHAAFIESRTFRRIDFLNTAKLCFGPGRAVVGVMSSSHKPLLWSFTGFSDASPSVVHLTVPRKARLRRVCPKWVRVHRADLPPSEVTVREGPVTTVVRTWKTCWPPAVRLA